MKQFAGKKIRPESPALWRKACLAILAIIISISVSVSAGAVSAKAMDLEYYGIEATINDDTSISTILTIRFAEPVTNAELALGYKALNLTVETSADSADCSLAEGPTSRISCSFSGMTKEKNLLTLKFTTRDGVSSSQNKYNFSSIYGIHVPIKDSTILIKIPQNSVLSEEQPNQSYVPSDGKILSNGKNIMVYWERSGLAQDSDMLFSVSYSIPELAANNNTLVVSVAGIVIICMIVVAIYVRRGRAGESTAEVVSSVLNSDEKKVVDILARHGGRSGQKIIVRESDFSKAKVSRLVKNLKDRGVVDIEPISGRENRIILKFDKKPETEKKPDPEEKIEIPQQLQKDPVIETESYAEDEEIK